MLSFYQRYALLPIFCFGVAKKKRPDAGWNGRNLIGGGQENYFFLEVENGYPVVYACYCAEKCVENFSL